MNFRYCYSLLAASGLMLAQSCSVPGMNVNFKDPEAVSQKYMEALIEGRADIVKDLQYKNGLLTQALSKAEYNEYIEDYVMQEQKTFQSQNGIESITVLDQTVQENQATVSFCLKTGNIPSGDSNELQSAFKVYEIGYHVSLVNERNRWKVFEASDFFGYGDCSLID